MYSIPCIERYVFLVLKIFISLNKSFSSLLLSLKTANSHIIPQQLWYME